jgi:hypothetical protein
LRQNFSSVSERAIRGAKNLAGTDEIESQRIDKM